ncbi:cell division protein FtsA [Anaeroselena agilis]|uniref:Cell division FtsA domain-containing protein n=1 Tax=Anaeroselena agilis TaxID=3063788 RepID=A0ABU3P1Q9_9FIRM|nr:cell division FtsA domain-containing protein [Selenomonadales bacterium 4137-cl]
MEKKLLFALDIGTRSVVGLVGEQTAAGIKVLCAERQEHTTRAMLDGQIHDVPEVAKVLARVTARLTDKVGELKKVSVAAAGRALCTLRAGAEIDCGGRGALTGDDERALELAAIQTAQHQLATTKAVADPTGYYCVGYSVVRFTLDGTAMKSLVGQRGKSAAIEVIATFLPRQVIDSLQAAIETVGLEMATLTLEPIAAINVLIPPTMRHLNLTLVDVGAGTSDVAITRDGSVIGYGMVPFAGDEVTEAVSQAYLLDFKVAEMLKRRLGDARKKVQFTDVLGVSHKLVAREIVERISPVVTDLAQAIAAQILALNSVPPQAVLLVGGGSLTPGLPESLAAALDIAPSRVAIRRPDTVDSLLDIPAELVAPDGVTPLGILRLAGGRSLTFVQVTLNGQPLRLFNLGKLTVADALLVAGIDVRSLHGRPGLGFTVTINGQKRFLPGSMGQPGYILVNGAEASFGDSLAEGDIVKVEKGKNGSSPRPAVGDLCPVPAPFTVIIDNELMTAGPLITVNGKAATAETSLADRDQVVCRQPATLAELLTLAGRPTDSREYRYIVNGGERTFVRSPEYMVNGVRCGPAAPVNDNDIIVTLTAASPTLADLLGLDAEAEEAYIVLFNGGNCRVPLRRWSITVAGKPATPADAVRPGSYIDYSCYEIQPMVSDVLLAAEFDPRSLPAGSRVGILVNGEAAEFTTPVKNGDKVDVAIGKII